MTKYIIHVIARPDISQKSFIIGLPPYKVVPHTGPQRTGWVTRAWPPATPCVSWPPRPACGQRRGSAPPYKTWTWRRPISSWEWRLDNKTFLIFISPRQRLGDIVLVCLLFVFGLQAAFIINYACKMEKVRGYSLGNCSMSLKTIKVKFFVTLSRLILDV